MRSKGACTTARLSPQQLGALAHGSRQPAASSSSQLSAACTAARESLPVAQRSSRVFGSRRGRTLPLRSTKTLSKVPVGDSAFICGHRALPA
jgi:hypothetical protein